ncbi:MAG: ankyrin repeat domain-containing protein [Candidatus Eremiobacteraeota bacterium]|nr:ankyrin repeat domain-containing protein [Candidatus Eremiobacteraeota bacterium]
MRGTRFTAIMGTTLMASTLLCQADPIHEAARRGDQSEINRIVAAQPEALEARDVRHGNTPLHWAAHEGHLDVVRTLIKNGANPNVHTKDGYTPLREAAFRGHTNVVQFLLEVGARAEEADKHGATPLHWAGHGGRTVVARLLLNAGASPLKEDSFGATAADWAAEAGQPDCARVMKHYMWPAVAAAISNDDRSQLKTLLKRYPALANLEVGKQEDSDHPTSRPICEVENVAQLEIFLAAGADPTATFSPTEDGAFVQTPIHHLSAGLLDRLLRDGANPDTPGEAGITPLAHAVWSHNLEQTEVLLRYGADPNQTNMNGNTPLHMLADETGRFPNRREVTADRHVRLANLLIESGSDVTARNSQGLTAEELARKNGHTEVAAYLRGVQ